MQWQASSTMSGLHLVILRRISCKLLKDLVAAGGLEPPTYGL